jgi:hypothetical protein
VREIDLKVIMSGSKNRSIGGVKLVRFWASKMIYILGRRESGSRMFDSGNDGSNRLLS